MATRKQVRQSIILGILVIAVIATYWVLFVPSSTLDESPAPVHQPVQISLPSPTAVSVTQLQVGNQVMNSKDQAQSRQLNDLLWTLKQEQLAAEIEEARFKASDAVARANAAEQPPAEPNLPVVTHQPTVITSTATPATTVSRKRSSAYHQARLAYFNHDTKQSLIAIENTMIEAAPGLSVGDFTIQAITAKGVQIASSGKSRWLTPSVSVTPVKPAATTAPKYTGNTGEADEEDSDNGETTND